MLSLDIETDPAARRLLSIGLHGCGASEVLLLTPAGWTLPGRAPCRFPTERELLAAFCRRVRELDPDVLTGWNVVDFDLTVLARLADAPGRAPRARPRAGRPAPAARRLGSRGARQASVPGRVVLDGIQLLRGAFIRMDDYGLDAVAREVLGEGKTLAGHGRAEEILRLFKEDRPRARRVQPHRRAAGPRDPRAAAARRARRRAQPPHRHAARPRLRPRSPPSTSSTCRSWDGGGSWRRACARCRRVEPQGGRPRARAAARALHERRRPRLQEPLPEPHPHVRDRSPEPRAPGSRRSRDADPIVAPERRRLRAAKGILTDDARRAHAAARRGARAGDAVKSHAIKILMNSFYGVLGHAGLPLLRSAPRQRDHQLRARDAAVVQGADRGRWAGACSTATPTACSWSRARRTPAAARAFGETLAGRPEPASSPRTSRERWRVESRLELVVRPALPAALPARGAPRHGRARASATRASSRRPDGPRVVFTGMEAVRGDWTDLAKEVQRELYARLFADQPVDEYLREVVAELRAGRSTTGSSTARRCASDPRPTPRRLRPTWPPRARWPAASRGRIAYVMTTDGPEPADERHEPHRLRALRREAGAARSRSRCWPCWASTSRGSWATTGSSRCSEARRPARVPDPPTPAKGRALAELPGRLRRSAVG